MGWPNTHPTPDIQTGKSLMMANQKKIKNVDLLLITKVAIVNLKCIVGMHKWKSIQFSDVDTSIHEYKGLIKKEWKSLFLINWYPLSF